MQSSARGPGRQPDGGAPPKHPDLLRGGRAIAPVAAWARWASVVALIAGGLGSLTGLLTGCVSAGGHSPFGDDAEKALRRSVSEAASRELVDATRQPKAVETVREPGVERLKLRPDIRDELEKMAGPSSYPATEPDLGADLMGLHARTATVSLERIIHRTIEHNHAVQFARLGPAVAGAQVVAAEAAFDWTFFSNLGWTNTDSPRVSTGTGSVATSPNADQNQVLQGALGLRRTLIGGGRFTVQNETSYTDNATPGQTSNPDPANQTSLTIQWDQPLLRNSGSDVALAQVRVARNAERTSIQNLKRDVMRSVTESEKAYWQLARAVQELRITQRLLERGEKTRDQVKERVLVDATNAQVADAVARVERRRTEVLRAQTQVRLISDQLKALANDPDVPLGSEVVLLPSDTCVDEPVRFSLIESLRTAVQQRPEVQAAILAIDDASIRQQVTDSQRLPDLALRLQTRFSAIDDEPLKAYDDLGEKFVDYIVGLTFEQPIGNRAAEAAFRQRRLERMQSIISYRNTIQQVVGETKNALNRVALQYALIEQTRVARAAAAENLRQLLVEKEKGGGYTVERLNLELNRQEELGAAEQAEATAVSDYNNALVDLFAAMGTSLERSNIEFVVPGVEETLGW